MNIKDDEVLLFYLDQELAWRKRELAYIKYLVDTTSQTNLDFNLRIGVTFLYAHWEGFIKNAARYYVLYVKNQKLNYEELTENFITASLKKEFVKCWNTKKTSIHHTLTNILLNNLSSKAIINENDIIQTESNLNYDTFSEILFAIGLDKLHYESKRQLIDSRLLEKRHHIAHGDRDNIDMQDYLELHMEIITILDKFHNQLVDSATEQSFKR